MLHLHQGIIDLYRKAGVQDHQTLGIVETMCTAHADVLKMTSAKGAVPFSEEQRDSDARAASGCLNAIADAIKNHPALADAAPALTAQLDPYFLALQDFIATAWVTAMFFHMHEGSADVLAKLVAEVAERIPQQPDAPQPTQH